VEELIERHIEFFSVDPETGFERTVCLPEPFVQHYRIPMTGRCRRDRLVSMPIIWRMGRYSLRTAWMKTAAFYSGSLSSTLADLGGVGEAFACGADTASELRYYPGAAET